MDPCDIKIIDALENLEADNDEDAERLRDELDREGTCLINIMSSPGSGKTTILTRTVRELGKEFNIAVIEADIDSDVDAKKIKEAGAAAVQLHTGGMCHLDVAMTRQGLDELGRGFDLCFIENIGNLVCPAEYDTGAHFNVCILSIPEGHDKPLKYPLMFSVCDVLIINKTDTSAYFDFDMEKIIENALIKNPKVKIFPMSAKTGEGFAPWVRWLAEQVKKHTESE